METTDIQYIEKIFDKSDKSPITVNYIFKQSSLEDDVECGLITFIKDLNKPLGNFTYSFPINMNELLNAIQKRRADYATINVVLKAFEYNPSGAIQKYFEKKNIIELAKYVHVTYDESRFDL